MEENTQNNSQLSILVQALYREMEKGLVLSWQEKFSDPSFLQKITPHLNQKEEIQEICREIVAENSLQEELTAMSTIMDLMQERLADNTNLIEEKVSQIEKYQTLVTNLQKKVDALEKEILQYRIEASETRLSSMDRCEELQEQIDQLKK